MKRLLLVFLVLALSASTARADISFVGGGGGGGGGASVTFDPTINTGSGVSGIAYAPEQFGAKGNVKTFAAGAMDNNVTANLTDTTNAPFTAGDVGKLICVNSANAATVTDHISTRHVESCGTISSFTSSSVVVLSFNNASGAAISGQSYAYGTDDTTAVRNAQSAACTAGGGQVFLTKTYGMSGTLTMCTTTGVNIKGNGGGVSGLGPGLWWLKSQSSTSPLSGHGILFSGTSGNTINVGQFTLDNIRLTAGIGLNYDGGSTSSAAIAIINWNDVGAKDVSIVGWGQAGIYTDVIANSSNDDVVDLDFEGIHVAQNLTGIQFGSAATAGFTGSFFQDVHIGSRSTIGGNLNFGINNLHDFHNLSIDGASLFQGNDTVASINFADFSSGVNCWGCHIKGIYFETDNTGERAIIEFPAAPVTGVNIENNFFLAVGASDIAIVLGASATNFIAHCTVANNYISNFTAGNDVDILGVSHVSLINNTSTAQTLDQVDAYGSTANVLAMSLTQAGRTLTGELATNSAAPTLTAGCNGTGVVAPVGTNFQGFFTTQTAAATTCTLTKSGAACANRYICQFWDDSASTTPVAISTGALSTTTAIADFASIAAKAIGYTCSCQ